MKLISCHIVKFGKLADTDLSFEPGLSGLLRENGAGKSTLTAFLSAMLFGLPTVNRRGVEFNDREHFRPYGGGTFGGSLVLKTDAGDEYRIERTFDEKSAASDDCTVYRNGAAFDCGGREIGEILFGVDADAFARTVFLSAETLDPTPGKSLSDRLCEAVVNPEGSVPAEKAIDALDAAATAIKKKKGKTGLLDQAEADAAQIEAELKARENDASRLPALRSDAEKCKAALAAARSKTLWASYDALTARRKEAEAELEKANARFGDDAPDGATLAEAEAKISAREAASREAEAAFAPSKKQTELAARFAAGRPDEAALAKMEAKAAEIRNAQQTALPTTAPATPAPAANRNAAPTLLAIGGGLMLLAGLIFLILSNVIPGALLLAAGVLSLGAAGITLFQGRIGALEKSIAVTDPGGVERARRAQLDAELAALLAPFGYSSPDGALAAFGDLKRDLAQLDDAENERAEAAKRRENAKEHLAALDRELTEFFARYGVSVERGFRAAMNELRDALRARANLAQEIAKAKAAADEFAARHGLTERPRDDGTGADAAAIAALERENTDLAVRIKAAEAAANGVPEQREKLERAKEKIEELKARYARLTATRDLMETAQTNLVGRYVDPVRTAFVAYADALSSFLGKTVSLDAAFELTFEADGKLRDHRHLSAGERSVAGLCLRMALADSLYAGKEQPPLVLDDPLVHLDENNLEKAKALLRQLAQNRQILCLTCHASRAV